MSTDSNEHEAMPGGTENPPIAGRVLLVEDQDTLRNTLEKQLTLDGHQVVAVSTIKEGLAQLSSVFDVALLDIDLPDGRGFDIVEELRGRASCLTSVVMMTGNPSEENLGLTMTQGILEFLFKPFGLSEMRASVGRAIEANRRWRDHLVVLEKRLASDEPVDVSSLSEPEALAGAELRRTASLRSKHGLTERECETLELLLSGLQNAQIADELTISANTVKYHVRNLLTKLGMSSRTELFRLLLNETEA